MPEMSAFLLLTQAIEGPETLLNVSLNASAIAPEGFVLLAMLGH